MRVLVGAWRRNLATIAALAGVAAGVAVATGTLTATAALAGAAAGAAAATATLTAVASMSGSSSGSSTVTGTLTISWSIAYGSMTFTRSSQGSYYSQAPTTGSSAFIAVASTDVLRTDNRDGGGALTLLEGARTNAVTYGRAIDNAYWTKTGGPNVVADQNYSPDGGASADQIYFNANNQVYRTGLGAGCASVFVRATSGSGQRLNLGFDGTVATGSASIGTTYLRLAVYGSGTYMLIETYDRSSVGGVGSGSSDVLLDFVQHEGGRFPSTPIGTNGSTGTRAADTLTLASGSVPVALFSGKGRFAQLSPEFAYSDLVSGDEMWLLSIGGSSNGIRIKHTGSAVYVEAVAGGVVKAYSPQLLHARDALLGAVAWDPAGGVVYVNGVAGPAGTAWSWSSGNIRVGGVYGGANEAFCRFGALQSW